jgi:glycosyltransferase involved in cell wall biosynthesis
LIKPGDEKEIKTAIEKILSMDKSQLEKLGQNGYQLVKQNYTWDNMVEKVVLEYKKLI